jgi:hypothetical protein
VLPNIQIIVVKPYIAEVKFLGLYQVLRPKLLSYLSSSCLQTLLFQVFAYLLIRFFNLFAQPHLNRLEFLLAWHFHW